MASGLLKDTKPEKFKIIYDNCVLQLGPIFNPSDTTVLEMLIQMVYTDAMIITNRIITSDEIWDRHIDDLTPAIIQCAVIGYQNRGVEGQTSQNELGQGNAFVDWHKYLREILVNDGKRYVI